VDFVFTAPANTGMHWMPFDLDFTATSNSTAISLLGISGENFFGVDNASVSAVPEPSSFILAALAAIGLVAYGTRQRAAKRAPILHK
jgi:hypothetical protein